MNGSGGFGYNTSRVKPDDPEPEIVQAAKRGDMSKLENLVKVVDRRSNPGMKMRLLVNQTRRWTEVDNASGSSKTSEWHGLTALATAALEGRADVVHYLLMVLADPTLWGCSTKNVHYDAFQAAENCRDSKPGKVLVKKLLDAVKPFWNPAEYGKSAQYDETRVTKGFPNIPTDISKMLEALLAIRNRHLKELGLVLQIENTPYLITHAEDDYIELNVDMDKMSVKQSSDDEEEEGAGDDSDKMADMNQPRLEGEDGIVGANGKCWKHQRFGHKARECAAPDLCKVKNSKVKARKSTKKSG